MGAGAVRQSDAGTLVWSGQPAGDAAAAVLGAQAAVAGTMLPQCLDDTNVEALHDLRVAVRRSRTVLGQLRRVFPREERRRFVDDLRWIQAITGSTRDLDVLLARWDGLSAVVPDDVRSALGPVHDQVRSRRAESFETMVAELHSSTFTERWRVWHGFVRSMDGLRYQREAACEPIEQVAAPRIDRAARRLARGSVRIDTASPSTALHDLRKQGKQLRYLLELFGDVCLSPEDVRHTVRKLKGLQEDLGRHQDDAVQIDLLRSIEASLSPSRGSSESGRSAEALGVLLDHIEADQRAARERALQRLAEGGPSRGAVGRPMVGAGWKARSSS